ncbi:MAG: type II toxin-antitoxin system HipA family toxin [Bacteroidota bacterium]|jgi:serine/threonine-protein kinase HipA
MEHIKKIFVSIQFNENEIELGELVSNDRNIYFKYYTDFISKGIEISPLKLKLNNEINKADAMPFNGLFGVFADSLPDGWGTLLLDRALTAKGIDVSDITMLDRLAFVGSNGAGALIYKPEINDEKSKKFEFELDGIAKAANQIITGTATEILDELYILGGSSGGARPKILVGYNAQTEHIIGTEKNLPSGYEHWLIKFPSSADRPDIANIEYAYYKMALDAGIEMSESKLFKGQSGQVYFGTKRFDRIGNNRLHMHSAAGIMHDNFRLSNLDYGNIMDCAFRLERDVRAYEKILRLAAFNIFAHNRDDHSKNISFLMDENGNWKIAPAYDLTFSSSSHGMHSTMVSGESANPTKQHLLELANYFKIKNASNIIDQVQEVIYNWKVYANQYNVSFDSKNRIKKIIGKNS